MDQISVAFFTYNIREPSSRFKIEYSFLTCSKSSTTFEPLSDSPSKCDQNSITVPQNFVGVVTTLISNGIEENEATTARNDRSNAGIDYVIIAAICGGLLVGIILILIIGYLCFQRRRKAQAEPIDSTFVTRPNLPIVVTPRKKSIKFSTFFANRKITDKIIESADEAPRIYDRVRDDWVLRSQSIEPSLIVDQSDSTGYHNIFDEENTKMDYLNAPERKPKMNYVSMRDQLANKRESLAHCQYENEATNQVDYDIPEVYYAQPYGEDEVSERKYYSISR